MTETSKKRIIAILATILTVTALCATVGNVAVFPSILMGILSPVALYIIMDERRKEKERKNRETQIIAFLNTRADILLFVFTLAQTYTFGTDLDIPQNVANLDGGYQILPDYTGFEMRLRFYSTGRTPIPIAQWAQKESIFQTDFDWGVQNGNLTGTIKVKRFYYNENAAWVDLEVTP